ncbi:hypothetical protein ASG54_09135 [Aureimonas sp. Leaf460]|nr:hypothetical protein ASG62_06540 [Aureimonas sp. Leaf427]KQT79469.1 hypothetical protein ASG54_09135 [Aureimonas sp. Leaf460]
MDQPGVAPARDGEPLAVIAGGGDLPRIVADMARQRGFAPRILAVGDGIGLDWAPYPASDMAWGRLGDAFGHLKSSGVRRMVLCGTVSVRPDFRAIWPSLKTLTLLPQIFQVIRGGDDSLLRAAAKAFEKRGFELLAVQEVAPELIMPLGLISRRGYSSAHEAAIRRGFEAAHALGALDVGQAVVASKDRVIALEGIEGTREMLGRVADLRRRGRIGSAEHMVLVKGVKPTQDLRFDLPSVGRATIEEAAAAGIAGIALSAGRALVIGFDDVVREADRNGIFVTGVASGEVRA